MNNICPKCGAGKTSLKCDFCGSKESIEERKENESSAKIIAYREYEVGNYEEALKQFNSLYQQFPNDISIITYKCFCNYHLKQIGTKELSNYLLVIIKLSNDSSLSISIISKFNELIQANQVLSILSLINKNLIEIIFNNENLYLFLKNIFQEELNTKKQSLINYHVVKNLINSKDVISKKFYNDFLYFINATDTEFTYKTESLIHEYDITESEILEFVANSVKGFINKNIFHYYFIINGNHNLRRWERIVSKINDNYFLIKDQINIQVNYEIKEYNYFREGNINNWKYEFPMSIEEVRSNIDIIVKKGEKKSSGSGCFIATAAMGSYEHPVVLDLRDFRDNWLLSKHWGISFVNWYYKNGPHAAKLIEKSIILRKITYYLIVLPLHRLIKIFLK
jgi:hypothetical protein